MVSALESVPLKSMQKYVNIILHCCKDKTSNLAIDLLEDQVGSQMHTGSVLIGNKPLGQPKNIGGIKYSLAV